MHEVIVEVYSTYTTQPLTSVLHMPLHVQDFWNRVEGKMRTVERAHAFLPYGDDATRVNH